MIPKTDNHQAAETTARDAAARVAARESEALKAQATYAEATAQRSKLLADAAQGEKITPKHLTAATEAEREAKAGLELAEAILGEARKQHTKAEDELAPMHNEWVVASHEALKARRRAIALEVDDLVRQANAKLSEASGLVVEHIALPGIMRAGPAQVTHIPQPINATVKVMATGFGEGIQTTAVKAANC